MAHREKPEPGSQLPPGFRRLGDQVPVVGKTPWPAWLVGLMVAAAAFAVILVVSRLMGFGDDPVVEEGLVWVAVSRARALTESSSLR